MLYLYQILKEGKKILFITDFLTNNKLKYLLNFVYLKYYKEFHTEENCFWLFINSTLIQIYLTPLLFVRQIYVHKVYYTYITG